jgi:hypothetical protein
MADDDEGRDSMGRLPQVGRTLHPNLTHIGPRGTEIAFSCGCGRPHGLEAILVNRRDEWPFYETWRWSGIVETHQSLPYFGMCQKEIATILGMLSSAERERMAIMHRAGLADSLAARLKSKPYRLKGIETELRRLLAKIEGGGRAARWLAARTGVTAVLLAAIHVVNNAVHDDESDALTLTELKR